MSKWASGEFCWFLFLAIAIFFAPSAAAQDYPEFAGYVNDYANLLSAPQASSLNQELRDFDNRTTIELAVVTVDSIGEESPERYAIRLTNLWGIGKRDKDNGIILLVAMDSRDIWIETGQGLSGEIGDSDIQRIVGDVIIPQFSAGNADQGVIDGTRAIIDHFDRSGISQARAQPSAPSRVGADPSAPSSYPPSSQSQGEESGSLAWIAAALAALIALPAAFFGLVNPRRAQAKENKARLAEIRAGLDKLVESSTAAIRALEELKARYIPSVWQSAEEGFSSVDLDKLELDYIRAEKASARGWINAPAAKELVEELDKSYRAATKNVNFPVERLAEARKAKKEYQSRLAGLEAAFRQVENEVSGAQLAVATTMELEKARQLYVEAKSMASQSPDTIDWILLMDRIRVAEEAVEKVSKDAARDRAIAQKIGDQDPEEILARMKETVDAAEKNLGDSSAARPDLDAIRAEYERARGYRRGGMNAIDLYLIMASLNRSAEHGHIERQREMQVVRQRAEERSRQRATPVRHSGFGRSGGGSFGGGRMGGGRGGGGKW